MDGIATYGIISRVMEALLSKEILTCPLIILSDSIMAAFDTWDTIANQVPVNFRLILTHFSIPMPVSTIQVTLASLSTPSSFWLNLSLLTDQFFILKGNLALCTSAIKS